MSLRAPEGRGDGSDSHSGFSTQGKSVLSSLRILPNHIFKHQKATLGLQRGRSGRLLRRHGATRGLSPAHRRPTRHWCACPPYAVVSYGSAKRQRGCCGEETHFSANLRWRQMPQQRCTEPAGSTATRLPARGAECHHTICSAAGTGNRDTPAS